MEVVANFKYLGFPLDQMDNDWPAVWRNIMCARSLWWRLGALLQWEVSDTKVLAMFYREVIKAVLLFGSET